MSCPLCGIELRAGARFCDGCGAPVAESPRAAPARRPYTPAHLSEKVLASRAAIEGERKLVTVLFADVKGSMELAEQVDAEEWHGILDRFFAILTAGIHRFEGTVNQYTGDGIMALFGAPIAHEDHAERACAAALDLSHELRRYAAELKRERSLGFSVRMGLNSGEVVVGRIGDDLRLDYTAQGHTVGLAARMQELCDPGCVYLTQRTAELVGDLFDREDLGEFRIRGAQEPVRVYALRGAGRLRTRFDVSRQRGLARFVGRAAELAALEREREGARTGGRAIGVSADAGVGKSRLFHELARSCRERGVTVHSAQCLAHGGAPLLPVVELFRSLLGVNARDGEEDARRKIAGTLLLLDPGLRDALPAVFELLGISPEGEAAPDADPERRRERLLEVAAAVLRRAGREQPVVVLVEDLHWADDASLGFLRPLVREVAALPALLLLNYRPSFAGPAAIGCREIALRPLPAEAAIELVGYLLGPDPSVRGLAERIVERASGNPFFAEEIVRSLAGSGTLAGEKGSYRAAQDASEPRIPPTVQALLAARIDQLPEREKSLLQAAAVIGKRFSQRLLEAVTPLSPEEIGRSLSELEAAELVFAEGRYPEPQLAFEHPLTQEVAYGSLLREKRRSLHAAIARALSEAQGDRIDDHAALVAHHWEEADEPVEAARWNRRAAQWLAGTHASEALGRLRGSLTMLAGRTHTEEAALVDLDLRESVLRLAPFADPVSGLSRHEAADLVAEGRVVAERIGPREPLASLLSSYGYFLSLKGDRDGAERLTREVSELSHEVADRTLAWRLRIDAAQNAFWAGRLHEAARTAEEAVEAASRGAPLWAGFSVGLSGLGFIYALRGMCRSLMGRRAEGRADLERALAAARVQGTPEAIGVAQVFRAFGAVACGELAMGAAAARVALEVASRMQHTFLAPMAIIHLALAELDRGSPAEARRLLEEVRATYLDADQDALFDAFALAPLAQAHLETGDREGAARRIELALPIAAKSNAVTLLFSHLIAARIALACGGRAAGATPEEHLAAAARCIEESGARSFLPRLHLARAQLASAEGDAHAAERERETARRLASEMGITAPPAG